MENENRSAWLVRAILLAWLSTAWLACGDDASLADRGGDSDAGAEAPEVDAGEGGDDAPDAGGTNGGDAGADAAAEVEVTPLAMADGSDGCEPGMLLDADEQCVEACSLFECVAHAQCTFDAETTEVACTCDANRSGEDCGCVDGLADDGDGNCVDPCIDFDCGMGTCSVVDSAPSCECPEHFVAGSVCDVCEPGYRAEAILTPDPICVLDVPATTGMRAWLDADKATSVNLIMDTSSVSSWSSLSSNLDFTAPAAGNRPLYNDAPFGTAQAAVEFDGTDDGLEANLTLGSSYSIFIVASAARRALDQTFLSGANDQAQLGSWLRTKTSTSTLLYRHSAGGINENVTITDVNLTERTLIEVHRLAPDLTLVAGDKSQSVAQTAGPVPGLGFDIGRRADAGGYVLDGSIHEIIVMVPAVPADKRAAYSDYLRAKWAL